MQFKNFLVLALLFLAAAGIAAEEDELPTLVSVPIKRMFIPTGFDSNDQIQVVVTGEFTDSCYKPGPHRVKREGNEVVVSQFAYHYKGLCLDMIVPYSQVIDVGIIRANDYAVVDGKTGNRLGALNISKAKTASVDDFLYAPVNQAMILEERGGAGPVLYLTGNFPNKSMRLKEVRILNYDDVMVVQPIAEIVIDPPSPADELVRPRFEVKQKLTKIPKGMFLLHVRSLNGKAVNKIEELSEAK